MMTNNPFPGLRPFESSETHLFFGRDGQSEELIRRLGRTRFLAVVGTSGSGKSSLVRAGLLPALQGGLMASAGSDWRVAMFRPGHDPIGNLSLALASPEVFGADDPAEAEMQTALAETTLRRSSLGLLDAVRQARAARSADGEPRLQPYENLLVVVDQFEELFRFRQLIEVENSKEDAAAFVRLLLEAVRASAEKIYVMLTMRSDFLGDCAQFQGLPEAINDGQYLIPRMTRDERREAVTGPVAVGGGHITEPLVNQLLNDMGDNPDQLPILQHALMRTWDKWESVRRNGEPIDLPHYNAIGGMEEALSLHAEEAFGELSEPGQEFSARQRIAEKLFKALTEKGADNREIRRPLELREACALVEADESEVVAVVETFRLPGRSFLMPPADVPLVSDSLIDISHESLIRNWTRLRKWTEEEAQSARIYRRLAETAVLHKAGEEALLKDPALQVALDWREKNKPNAAWAGRYHPEFETAMSFLDASVAAREAEALERQQQQRREVSYKRTRLAAFILGLAVILALLSAVYAARQSLRARAAAVRADEAALKTRQLLYPSDINLAHQAIEENNFEHAKELLAAHAPAEGEQPRFTWGYLWRLIHNEKGVISFSHGSRFMNLMPDDRTLLVHNNNRIELLDPATGQTLPSPFGGLDPAQPTPLVLSPDGKTLLAVVTDPESHQRRFMLLDAATGRVGQSVSEREHSLSAFTFAPDGRSFAWVDRSDESVRLWEVESLREVAVVKPGYAPWVLAFSPDGRSLATGGEAPSPVTLWDLGKLAKAAKGKVLPFCEEARPPCAITPITDDVKAMTFSPDGRSLMIAFSDMVVWQWDVARNLWEQKVPGTSGISSLRFSSDGKTLAIGYGNGLIKVQDSFDLTLGVMLGGHHEPVRSLAFSRDGKTLYTGSNESVRIWDVETAVRARLPLGSGTVTEDPGEGASRRVTSVSFSPDGRTLAVARRDVPVTLWDITTRQPTEVSESSDAVAFSPDGRTLAFAAFGGPVTIWDRVTQKTVGKLGDRSIIYYSLSFSPDGKLLVTGDDQGGVALWSLPPRPNQTKLREVSGSRAAVRAVAFSPDGQFVAACFDDGVVKVWDKDLGGEQVLSEGGERDALPPSNTLAFSPDGRLLAVGLRKDYDPLDAMRVHFEGGFIRLWEIKSAGGRRLEELPPLKAHRGDITSLSFSSTGLTLYSSSGDGTAKLWDTISFREVVSVLDETTFTTSSAFSPDGRLLASGDMFGNVRLLRSASKEEVEKLGTDKRVAPPRR